MGTRKISLDASFGYQLRMVQIEADKTARRMLEPFDITPARVTALIVVANNPGCTQTRLGEELSINRASAMKLVNILEGRGLIRRGEAADPRANALFLTEEGSDQLKRMLAALNEADEHLLRDLTNEERAAMRACLAKMRRSFAADN
ncbi:MarR family winged helix-turn-helix transcriptional regulator [Croceicoccus sediminis]|uniref:MarR family winged helix-turn-helix transcriptional regulator n=1 Tax=Croceicoccus sediminis TaxID=2571150 RepID=UPI001F0F5189|nr:MarR family transcriptional regulator [Croceicoccus sediminis]